MPRKGSCTVIGPVHAGCDERNCSRSPAARQGHAASATPTSRGRRTPVCISFDGEQVEALPGETAGRRALGRRHPGLPADRERRAARPVLRHGRLLRLPRHGGRQGQPARLPGEGAGGDGGGQRAAGRARCRWPRPRRRSRTAPATCWWSAPARPGWPRPSAAAAAGAPVVVLDERGEAGGQYLKPLAASHAHAAPDRQFRQGDALRARGRGGRAPRS